MSLVAYDSSSESEDESPIQQPKRSLPTTNKKTLYVDLPKLDDDDDDEEEERKPKRAKISAGLGLADLLPAPKNTRTPVVPVTKSTTDKAFIPHALSKKLKGKQKETAPVKPAVEDKEEAAPEEEEEEEESAPKEYTGSFFHIGKELRKELAPKPSPKPATSLRTEYSVEREPPQEEEQEPQMTAVDMYAYDPNAMYSADPSVYYQYQQDQEAYYNTQQDAQQFEEITGIRGSENIQIKSVNQDDILLSEQDRAIRNMTQAPKFNTGPPMQASKLQMMKNNIMALAAHAVNNQEKLDEMFAANKRTRRDAAKKYGF